MILAILDDLMFTSKIKTAASHLGVPVTFARSSEAALVEMRKSQPALAAIPTMGFASHVQVDVINAARQAGVDEVLARSAFTERLGEILTRRA